MMLNPARFMRTLALALLLTSCGEDSDASPDEAPVVDAGRKRDASTRGDAKADAGDEGAQETSDAGNGERPDAPVRDAAPDARAANDAATRDAAATSDAGASVSGETGRMVGMTAAHNAVRAMVETTMSLPEMTWNNDLAAYAQEWADTLAKTACMQPRHRTGQELQAKGYGENLAYFGGYPAPQDSAEDALMGWANEVECYTYGAFMKGDACNTACYTAMHSDGCGHYTQVVWRKSTQLGCGFATCNAGGLVNDIWICNYAPAGNFIGQKPY